MFARYGGSPLLDSPLPFEAGGADEEAMKPIWTRTSFWQVPALLALMARACGRI